MMPLDKALPITRQIAEAIEYVHESASCTETSNRPDPARPQRWFENAGSIHEPPLQFGI
jgi:hypothetical protein